MYQTAFAWACQGASSLLKRRLSDNDKASLEEAFLYLEPCLPERPTKLQVKRHAVASVAVFTSGDAVWKSQMQKALEAGRHFEVHCLLQSHESRGALRDLSLIHI